MGFGVVKGFARKVGVALTSVLITGGGGQALNTETALTDTVILQGGGDQIAPTETALTETVVLALGSYP